MANNKVGGKRKRQQSHSEQDKFAHKSGVLLQREAKKVRVFLVRKVVQQLKQSRGQLEAAQREHGELTKKPSATDGADADDVNTKHNEALVKKDKQVKKLQTTVTKLEKELEVFKALDLKAVAARAMAKTGLERKQQEEQQKKLQQQQLEQQKQQSRYGGVADSDSDESDDVDGRERHLADESGDDDDDGFDSEEYENSRRANGTGGDDSGSESESESDGEQEDGDAEGAPDLVEAEPMKQSEKSTDVQKEGPAEKPSAEAIGKDVGGEKQEIKSAEETKATEHETKTQQQNKNTDLQMQNVLIDRILAHKQMKPLLDAIEKVIEKDEREAEKKLRKQEKKALKRDRNEVLIGGRSSAAPTSLFLGSLSGRGGVIDDDVDMNFGMSSSYMDGAEDDIAEFLGEKKKKNRMGQNARRQKAIRMEETAKRKQDRENGIFRPFGPRKEDTLSKYGPSERPKKKKPAVEVQNSKSKSARGGKPGRDGKPERGGERDQRRGERGAPRERERGAPAPVSSRPTPFKAPPTVDVSHPSWIAKQKLKEKEKASITAFSGKKITFGDDYDLFGKGILASDGAEWYFHRKTANNLFSNQMMRDVMYEAVSDKVETLCKALQVYESRGEPVSFTSDVFGKISFSVDLNCLENGVTETKANEFVKAFATLTRMMYLRFMQPTWLWKLKKHLNISTEKENKESREVIDEFIFRIINESITKKEKESKFSSTSHEVTQEAPPKDLISLFLSSKIKEEENVKGTAFDSEMHLIRDTVVNFIFAGKDTTSHSMSWFILMMNRYPKVLEKIRAELRKKLPQLSRGEIQVPSMNDLPQLTYLEAAIRENLRLNPAAPISPWQALEDVVLCDGTPLPKGTRLGLSIYSAGRLKSVWGEDALEFKPERWIDSDTGKLLVVAPFKFMAFGGGRRNCIGMKFAMMEIKCTLAVLLSRFDFQTLEDPWTMTYEAAITMGVKGPLAVKISSLAVDGVSVSPPTESA